MRAHPCFGSLVLSADLQLLLGRGAVGVPLEYHVLALHPDEAGSRGRSFVTLGALGLRGYAVRRAPIWSASAAPVQAKSLASTCS